MKTKRNRVFKYHGLNDKEMRNLLIFDLIRRRGVISRTEISKITGVNVVSVSNYINNYLDKKLVLDKGLDVSTGGRKPELVELNTRDNFVIGVDASGPEIRVALVDIGMKVVEKRMAQQGPAADIAAATAGLVEDVIAAAGVAKACVKMIGISTSDGKLAGLNAAVEKALGVPAFNGGVASCAAYAEKRLNPHANVSSLLYMHSDIGRGIMISGDICFGSTEGDSAMESADAKVTKGTGPDMLRYMRPWDEYLGMAATAQREVSKGIGTKMASFAKGDVRNITEDVVMEAARQNDEVALNIVQSVGINLGLRAAFLTNLFTPEAVIVGGGPEKAGDIIFAPMRKMAGKLSFKKLASNVRIAPGVAGEDAVMLGAASLAIREMFLQA